MLVRLLLISIAPPAMALPAQVSAVLKRANKRFPLPSEAQIRTAIDGYLQRQKAANGLKCVPTGIRLSDLRPATSDALILAYILRG